MEEVRNVAVPQEMSQNEIRREKAKKMIEAMYLLLRRTRKLFLDGSQSEDTASFCKLGDAQLSLFKQLISVRSYYQFQMQVSNVLVEGIKYPDHNVKNICRYIFLITQEEEINPYLWKKILSADFIPAVAQEFIQNNRSKLEAKPAIAYLLDGCEEKFLGKEREAADFVARESLKRSIEELADYVRMARKMYRMERKLSMARLDETQINNAQTALNFATYSRLPIQVADLVYEGIKSPDERLEQMAIALAEELLKLNKLDVYFWTKMLMSDFVPDKVWRLLRDYPEVFKPQMSDLRPFIVAKTVYGRSETSNEIYNEVLNMYVKL
ncbi:MAG: hypothetical protein IJX20_04715 [Alphaproteobacteria bacterium]|nr:hypothetical protein [Alphaproteobacteria bacterium]